ncbi:hypothetical protein ACU686_14880 [Yinghuangia aomiensis]
MHTDLTADADSAAPRHGHRFLLIGKKTIFSYHLGLYYVPIRAFQMITALGLPDQLRALYLADLAGTREPAGLLLALHRGPLAAQRDRRRHPHLPCPSNWNASPSTPRADAPSPRCSPPSTPPAASRTWSTTCRWTPTAPTPTT